MDYKEKLKAIINSNKTPFVDIDTFLKYFPELKESEDERVRNKLIEFFKGYYPDEEWWGNITQEDILAWLGKQGEQINYNEELKKCKENPLYFYDKYCKIKIKGQKPTKWSEEDIRKIDELIALCEGRKKLCSSTVPTYKRMDELKDWLKTLRPQSTWKPSDEQMKALEHAINCYSDISPTNTEEVYTLEIMKEQLKKLKE